MALIKRISFNVEEITKDAIAAFSQTLVDPDDFLGAFDGAYQKYDSARSALTNADKCEVYCEYGSDGWKCGARCEKDLS
ncbi:hypothetical protein [Mesorhizobium sp. M0589]|uniref:hypothetical protein n=1 Tax=Mesorhizobium sp. M0589 TaxID=2956965 RepID=UPI00333DE806